MLFKSEYILLFSIVLVKAVFANDRESRAVSGTTDKWENGIIPYTYDKELTEDEIKVLRQYMDYIERKTFSCIHFIPRTNENAYVFFNTSIDGCLTDVGKRPQQEQPQNVYTRRASCGVDKRNLLHEILHSTGAYHTHQRPDRDNFIEVKNENIKTDAQIYFTKKSTSQVNTLGLPYDYSSVMHYPYMVFSINDKPTIVPKDSMIDNESIGSDFMSLLDTLVVRRYYGCIPDKAALLKIRIRSNATSKLVSCGPKLTALGSNSPYQRSTMFYIFFNNDATVSLKSVATNKYVTVLANNDLAPTKSSITGDKEKFYILANSQEWYYLKSKSNGKYVNVGQGFTLSANGNTRGDTKSLFSSVIIF